MHVKPTTLPQVQPGTRLAAGSTTTTTTRHRCRTAIVSRIIDWRVLDLPHRFPDWSDPIRCANSLGRARVLSLAGIARQKNMGMAIGNELDDQDVMLSDLNAAMDNTDAKLTRQTNQVIRVTEKAKGMSMCCCIALLAIAIVAVWSV